MRKKMRMVMETDLGGRVYGAYYVLLPPLRPLGSDPFCACVCEVFLVCFEHIYFFFKEENVHCLFCSPLKYSKKRKARDGENMCARICAFVLFPDEWPSVTIELTLSFLQRPSLFLFLLFTIPETFTFFFFWFLCPRSTKKVVISDNSIFSVLLLVVCRLAESKIYVTALLFFDLMILFLFWSAILPSFFGYLNT